MSEPMDLAMRLLKDFYFGGASPQNMEGGVFRPTWLPEGAAENIDPNLIQNQPNYFGVNLSQQTQEEDPSQRRSAYQDEEGNWLSDEEIAQKLMGTLGHEQLHVAQDPALREAYGMGEDPLQSKQFGDFLPAHEYGAISSTTPDMTQGALDYAGHPQLNYNPAKETAASDRYMNLATSPLSPSFEQGFRSQQNALQQMGVPQQQITQANQQGMLPQQVYQQFMQQPQQQIQTGEPMDLSWRLLKASRQMKLYNYIEDYPGMEPVTAYRGVPLLTTKPMPGSKWYQKSTPIDLDGEGTWWVEDTREPHATASWFGRLSDDPKPNPVVLGHRGELESSGYVQRRKGEWNPANDTRMNEAFVSHNKPIDWEKIVLSRPSQSVTENMDIAEHDAWLDAWSRGDM